METRIFRLQCKTDEALPEFLRATLKQCLEIYHPKGCLAGGLLAEYSFFFGFLSSSLKRETFFYVNSVVKSKQ